MTEAMGGEAPLEVTWKPFSLAQVNQKTGDPDYRAWSEPDESLDQSLWGLRAGQAARRQGEDALRAFLPLLLSARHQDRVELNDMAVLQRLAGEAGLDVDRFTADLDDRSTLDEIADSHTHAVEELGVFGTPTFVFEGGGSAFLKLILTFPHQGGRDQAGRPNSKTRFLPPQERQGQVPRSKGRLACVSTSADCCTRRSCIARS